MPTVLCVDDDPAILRVLARTLESQPDPVEVHQAQDGRAALDLLRRHAFDLVITDLQMPFMDGFELLVHLVGRPALVVTALDPTFVQQRLGGTPILSVLYKPFRPVELKRLVTAFLLHSTEGRIQGVSLVGVLELLHLERRSCLVIVRGAGEDGWLLVEEGEVRDALAGDLRGLDAALELLASDPGGVELRRPPGGHDVTVTMPLRHLVLEAARQRDEHQRAGFRLHPPVEAAPVRAAPTDPREAAVDELIRIDGAVAAVLFELGSGRVVAERALAQSTLSAAASAHAEALRAYERLQAGAGGAALDGLVVTTGAHHHLVRRVGGPTQLAALLVVRREGAAIGLARHRLEQALTPLANVPVDGRVSYA